MSLTLIIHWLKFISKLGIISVLHLKKSVTLEIRFIGEKRYLLCSCFQYLPLNNKRNEGFSHFPLHLISFIGISSVQSLSCVRLFATPWTAAHQASLFIPNSRSLPKLTSIESVMPSNHLILCCPLFLLPSVFPNIRVFSNESALHIRWPKYWSFSFYISPSKEHPGLISFRMDWLDVLAVQGTLKNLLQYHSSKASILQCSSFFTVQLSHPYMTTEKTIALTRWTFVDKVMSLLFNMLSRLIMTFLPRSKRLLISWLQSPFTVILEPQKLWAFYFLKNFSLMHWLSYKCDSFEL